MAITDERMSVRGENQASGGVRAGHGRGMAEGKRRTRGVDFIWTTLLVAIVSFASPASAGKPVRVGVYNFEPLIGFSPQDQAHGLFIDIVRYVAQDEGWDLEFVAGTWNECLERVKTGEIDLLPSIGYSQERARFLDFSKQFLFLDWGVVYVAPNSPIRTVFDLKGKRVAVLRGSIYTSGFLTLAEQFGIQVQTVEKGEYEGVFRAIADGETDAGINAQLYGLRLQDQFEVKATDILFSPVKLRFASPKGRYGELLSSLDERIQMLKGDESSYYYQLLHHYTGQDRLSRAPPRWLLYSLGGALGLALVSTIAVMALRRAVVSRTRELSESEERFRQLAENIDAVFWVTTPDRKSMLYISPAFEEIWGRGVQEFYARPMLWADCLHPQDRERVLRAAREQQTTGEYQEEYRIVHPDGAVRWVRDKAFPMADEDGEVYRIVGLAVDITERKHAEEALRASEEKFRDVFEEASVGNSLTLLSGEVVANQALADLLGYSREELAGKTWQELTPAEDVEAIQQRIAPLFTGAQHSVRFTKRYLTKSGSVVWGDVSAVLRRDPDGQPLHFITTVVDITDRVQAEEALRRAEERFSGAFRASPAGLTITRIADGTFLEVNDAFLGMSEFSRSEVVGHTSTELGMWTPEERAKIIEAQLHSGGLRNRELRARSRSGRIVDLLFSSASIELGGEDCLVTTLIDITDRKRAEEALRESETRLRLTLKAMNIGLWDWNMQTDLWYATPIYFQMLGYDPDVDGQNREVWGERTHPDDRAFVVAKMEDVRDRGEPSFDIEFRFRHADGAYHWINSIGRAVEFDAEGRATRMLGLQVDITPRRQAAEELNRANEELERRVAERTASLEVKARELEQFSYTVSHDLKAPLRGIDGYSRLLLDDHAQYLDAEGRLFVENIRRAAGQMGQLIDDLLAYSRMERRRLALSPVDSRALALSLLAERSGEVESRGVSVRVEVPFGPVSADLEGLSMALRNILDNALKFTSSVSGATIEIGGREDADSWLLWVRDNGIGFEPGYAEKVFEIFQRLHGGDEYGGTGIGLAIVRKALERMGGRAWAEGRPGRGATFYLELPKTEES